MAAFPALSLPLISVAAALSDFLLLPVAAAGTTCSRMAPVPIPDFASSWQIRNLTSLSSNISSVNSSNRSKSLTILALAVAFMLFALIGPIEADDDFTTAEERADCSCCFDGSRDGVVFTKADGRADVLAGNNIEDGVAGVVINCDFLFTVTGDATLAVLVVVVTIAYVPPDSRLIRLAGITGGVDDLWRLGSTPVENVRFLGFIAGDSAG